MGIDASKENPGDWLGKLKPHQELQDPVFGPVEILRCTEPPYEYIMKYKRSFCAKDATYEAFEGWLRRFQELQNKSLAKLHRVTAQEETYVCTKAPSIYCYLSYYNFTLRRALERKKAINSRFPEEEVWFVATALVDLARYLKAESIALADFSSDRIYLAPDGSLKIYLLNVLPNNQHNPCYQVLADPQQFSQYILSPEQINSIINDEYEISFDIYKSDLFVIGMILLEMMTLRYTERYYNGHSRTINIARVKQELQGLSGEYSPNLTSLVKRVLEENPSIRPDLETAHQYIKMIESTSPEPIQSKGLRLTEDDTITHKRKKAIQTRRQKLEEQESSIFSNTLSFQTTTPSFQSDKPKGIRKVSLVQLGRTGQSLAMSIKSRDFTPLRKNVEKISTYSQKNNKLSLLDPPLKTFKRRFQ